MPLARYVRSVSIIRASVATCGLDLFMPLIELRNLGKTYDLGEVKVSALTGVTLNIDHGEFVALIGPSGSGKSTLMNTLGCLDRPTKGKYRLDGVEVSGMSKDNLARLRNKQIGFVFQNFNLLARTTALENVEIPMLYDRAASRRQRRDRERVARSCWTVRSSRPQAESTVRGATAAGRHRPRAREPARDPTLRRTDRESRYPNEPGDHGLFSRVEQD